MEYVWLTLAIVTTLVGLAGALLPVLPGPPVSYVALWMLYLYDKDSVSSTSLWVMGILMLVLTFIDYVAPVCLTRIGGGSRQAMRGATAGLLVGLFCGPVGMIVGPFVGALLGELLVKTPAHQALKVALYSFLAFILTTGLKFFYGIAVVCMVAIAMWW
ncbi:MAG: DUF456 domain-containing protein [Bacteroidaceae bacterium]|nr:DUF456 domain-containing protein [Bacteroidaceae bacterium]